MTLINTITIRNSIYATDFHEQIFMTVVKKPLSDTKKIGFFLSQISAQRRDFYAKFSRRLAEFAEKFACVNEPLL